MAGDSRWSEESDQPSRSSLRICGDMAGVRPLPRSKLSIAAVSCARQLAGIDAVVAQHRAEVGGRQVEELQEQMLDLDVVVGLRHAERRRRLQRALGERIESRDQSLEARCSWETLGENHYSSPDLLPSGGETASRHALIETTRSEGDGAEGVETPCGSVILIVLTPVILTCESLQVDGFVLSQEVQPS